MSKLENLPKVETVSTSISLPVDMINDLTAAAEEDGVDYQILVKQILAVYIYDRKENV